MPPRVELYDRPLMIVVGGRLRIIYVRINFVCARHVLVTGRPKPARAAEAAASWFWLMAEDPAYTRRAVENGTQRTHRRRTCAMNALDKAPEKAGFQPLGRSAK